MVERGRTISRQAPKHGQENTIVRCIIPVPGLTHKSYENLGDVNIGAFFTITEYAQHGLCAKKLQFPLLQQYVEAMVFAVKKINEEKQLLPNMTLGYAILDDCVKESAAVAQALKFIPRRHCKNMTLLDSGKQYDVVGVIGPMRSENSIAVSLVLGPVKIPQVSFISTSDELSNKELHSYFLRLVPSDKLQIKAMLTFIKSQKWNYVSIVYSSGSYGEFAYNNFKQTAPDFGVCMAAHRRAKLGMSMEDYKEILNDLLQFPNAKVVIAFLSGEEMTSLFQSVHEMNLSGKFIWIGSDGWSERLTMLPRKYESALYGSFTFFISAPKADEFYAYFDTVRPSNTSNPWFREFWEWSFDCSFENKTCDEAKRISEASKFHHLGLVSKVIDTVYVYAHALSALIKGKCSNTTVDAVRECINGTDLMRYLKNVSFQGYSGYIKFDSHGNLNGSYLVSQIIRGRQQLVTKPVYFIDPTVDGGQIDQRGLVTWDYFDNPRSEVPPASLCSRPCSIGQYRIPKLMTCCWECGRCRENEIVFGNKSSCQPCPAFSWPDPLANFTQCSPIEPKFPLYTDGVVVFEMVASGLGVLTTFLVFIAFLYYKEASIIKAASRELSFLQLLAILLGFVTMLLYVLPPSDKTCSIAYWLFCFSLNLLHAPLLVKAVRIYRIFLSPAKCARGLRFINPLSQVVISCLIVLGQVIISSIITSLQRPRAKQTHPVSTVRYVELSCDMTLAGLGSFLGYNLTIVLLCSVFAFKTRMVPDNFNESRFISVCVTTTLVVWLAFIPTYIHSARQYLKTLLLTLALLLNHSLALVFLFLSKLFAILYYNKSMNEVNPALNSPALRFKLSTQHINLIKDIFNILRQNIESITIYKYKLIHNCNSSSQLS
ncbi:Metabotropic glutamate receptor 1 [Bulinus truncatus]|nr:Metabotropic glutamate receptor 1 [Bulinus truncatus]